MFEYDKKKSISNQDKHGVKLEEASNLWESEHIIIPARTTDEERFIILGEYKNKVHMCVFTFRDEKVRLISFHRADKKFERFYYEEIK